MRNLKKALAMVLALMMALSLMSFASASDYADGGKIEKNEAVEVMSMINVFQGTDGGNFDPEGNLTRAQAAKIISYMKLGSAVADALPKDEAPFDDVKADRWYTGYVTYAKSEGIIAGRSETTFDPNGNVTGYEFGKMVLEAAGIKGEYTGTSSWMLNINLALRGNNPGKVNLMDGVNAVLSSPISRENACQMAFNGLNYTATGETTGNFVITGTAGSGTDLNGMVCSSRSEAAILISVLDSTGDYTIEAEKNNRGSLADVVFSLEKTRGTSTFGAPANVWTSGDKSVTVADAAAKSYESTTGKAIKADLKMSGTVNAVIVTDGLAASAVELTDATTLGGNGAKVDVYKTGDNTVKIVVVNTYVATIASHTDAKGDNKEKITLTVDGTNKPATTTNGDFETTNFTADDKGAVVLYTAKKTDATNATIQSVTVPAEVKGTVTRYNTTASTFVVDGKTYKTSLMKHSLKGVSAANVGEEITLYLDNNGHVIYATGDAAPDAVYGVVVDWAKGGEWASSAGFSVKVLLTDGSIVEKTLAGVKDTDGTTDVTVNETNVRALLGTIVKYAEDGSKATLTKTTDANSASPFTEVVRNKPTLKDGLVANSKTVFLIGSKDGKTLNVYNGINAVPSVQKLSDGDPIPAFVAVAENGVAKVVYIAKSEPKAGTTDVTDVIYVVGQGESTKDMDKGEYKIYPAVVNGEITTIETTTGVTGMPAADNAAVLLQSVTKNDKDLITAGTAMSGENFIAAATSNTAPADSVIKVGANSYVYDDNTKVYVVENGEISVVAMNSVEANEDGVSVTGYTKNGVIVELFILKGAAAGDPPIVGGHTHNLTWTKGQAAQAATCTTEGKVEYWTATCDADGCESSWDNTKKYSKEGTATGAAEGATEVTKTTIDALGHDVTYTSNSDGTHNGTACSRKDQNGCSQDAVSNESCDTSGADGACSKCGYKANAGG